MTNPLSSAPAAESLLPDPRGLQQKLAEAAHALRREKRRKLLWQCLAGLLLALMLGTTRSSLTWLPVADSPQMCVVLSQWWGLKVQTVFPVWTQPTGETQDYSEQWCLQYPDKTWRVFYHGDGDAPSYTYALTNYATYF